jgi:hypothetical protein
MAPLFFLVASELDEIDIDIQNQISRFRDRFRLRFRFLSPNFGRSYLPSKLAHFLTRHLAISVQLAMEVFDISVKCISIKQSESVAWRHLHTYNIECQQAVMVDTNPIVSPC